MREVARLCVPQLADAAVVALAGGDGASARGRRSSRAATATTATPTGCSARPLDAALHALIDEAAATGVPQRLPREGGEGRYALPDGLSAHALAAFPLAARGRPIAVLLLAMTGARRLDADALALAGDIATRAAAALESRRTGGPTAPGRRPAQGRVPGHARPRAAQPARADSPTLERLRSCWPRRPASTRRVRARDIIERQVRHLTRLVDDLLDVSRITPRQDRAAQGAGRARRRRSLRPPRRAAADRAARTHELVGDAAAASAAAAGRRDAADAGARRTCSTTPPSTPTRAARSSCAPSARATTRVIRVRDNGVGIAAEMLPQVFDLFVPGRPHARPLAGRPGHRPDAGAAAGRAARRQRRGEQRGPGPGQRVHGAAAGVDAPSSRRAAGTPRGGPSGGRIATSRGAACWWSTTTSTPPRASRSCSAPAGHEVQDRARRPAGARRRSTRSRPHVVLLDIGLPGLDGYEVARRLRERARRPARAARRAHRLRPGGGPGARAEAGFDYHLDEARRPTRARSRRRSSAAATPPARPSLEAHRIGRAE